MLGLQIHEQSLSSSFASLSVLGALFSIGFGVGIGPSGMYVASGIGMALSICGLFLGLRQRHLGRPIYFPIVTALIHAVLLIIAAGLQALFLQPLSRDRLNLPRFQFNYTDPEGFFNLRGPTDWSYEGLPSRYETGVRLRPMNQTQYMGISEITVLIRELESKPDLTKGFLEKLALNLAQNKEKESQQFNFQITPAKLLSGEEGTWTTLDLKKFWIPIHQVSLLGIKNKRYLCSVSAIGLKAHATLSTVACLGIFHSINVNPGKLN